MVDTWANCYVLLCAHLKTQILQLLLPRVCDEASPNTTGWGLLAVSCHAPLGLPQAPCAQLAYCVLSLRPMYRGWGSSKAACSLPHFSLKTQCPAPGRPQGVALARPRVLRDLQLTHGWMRRAEPASRGLSPWGAGLWVSLQHRLSSVVLCQVFLLLGSPGPRSRDSQDSPCFPWSLAFPGLP